MFAAPHRLPRGDRRRRVGCHATLAERRDVAGLNAVFLAVAKILLGGGAPIRCGHHTVVVVEIDEISGNDVQDNHLRSALRRLQQGDDLARIGSALKNLTSTPGARPSGIQGIDSSEMQLASTCSKNIAFSVLLISARTTGATTLRDSYACDCRNCDKVYVMIQLPRYSAI